MDKTEYPFPRYRPFGLTIAILATGIAYGIIPLLPLLLVIWTAFTRRRIGMDIVNTTENWISMAVAAVTLIASLWAWAGRPRWSRRFLLICIWGGTAFRLWQMLRAANAAPGIEEIGGSLSGVNLLCVVPPLIVIPLYVTWYLNRAPARQFYR
ncbi:MAG TPA: hypothetical protein PLD47_10505 [Aggregatilineales bacterium]|nr:hypothetical protein [Anaerolineales bacterium]HRE48145.1 hypothetical protein [Aggregatilineales bacterium]